jgi:hypothetical protein
MNWRRGLFRSWLLLSFGWITFVVILFSTSCFYLQDTPTFDPMCITDGAPAGSIDSLKNLSGFAAADILRWFLRLFAPPVALLTAGSALIWVVDGFRRRPS